MLQLTQIKIECSRFVSSGQFHRQMFEVKIRAGLTNRLTRLQPRVPKTLGSPGTGPKTSRKFWAPEGEGPRPLKIGPKEMSTCQQQYTC